MAVREFNGSSDQLVCAIGAASGMTFGTFVALVKINNGGTDRALGHLHNSGGTWLASPGQLTSGNTWGMHDGVTSSDSGIAVSTGVWYLLVMRKATGTATPRFSSYNFNTTTWTHAAGGNAEINWTAPGVGGNIQFSFQNGAGDFLDGRIAARALWSNTLPWTADASGDTAIQNAGLHTAAANWASNNPTAFWLFNQASTGISVPDLSPAGTAGQSSINGTTVVNGDDPPGFNFSLGGGPAVIGSQQVFRPFMFRRPSITPFQMLGDATPTAPGLTQANAGLASATGTAFDATASASADSYQAPRQVAWMFLQPNAAAFQFSGDRTVTVSGSTSANAGLASGTGTAFNPSPSIAPSSGLSTGTGAASNPQPAVSPGSGAATAAGTANGTTSQVSPTAGSAAATGAAQDPSRIVAATPTTATATGTAFNATVQTGSFTNAAAGLASATGTANDTTLKVATGPTTATGTGTANDAVVNTGGNTNAAAGLATATGTAFNATVTRTANAQAGLASATGTVPLVSMRIAAQIQAAQAIAQAFGVIPNQVLVGTAHAATGSAPTASAATMTVPTATGG